MQIVLFILLIIVSGIHLYHSWIDDFQKRRYTKPLLMPMIILYYVVAAGVENVNLLLLGAFLTSWIGDVLLMLRGNRWFVMGGCSFLVSHLLLIALFVTQGHMDGRFWPGLLLATAVYYGAVAALAVGLWEHMPGKMGPLMTIYMLANGTMNICALCHLLAEPGLGSAFLYAGAFLFFFSDCVLGIVRFSPGRGAVFRGHFTVMLTYILSQVFLAQGMIFQGIGK